LALLHNHPDVVVEQALDPGHRRCLADEVGKGEFDCTALRIQAQQHVVKHAQQTIDIQQQTIDIQWCTPLFEHLDKAGHVRALHLGRQANRHRQPGYRVLNGAGSIEQRQRVAQVLDANLVNRQLAKVGAGLHVGKEESVWGVHFVVSMVAKRLDVRRTLVTVCRGTLRSLRAKPRPRA